jgi:hypothetical protein
VIVAMTVMAGKHVEDVLMGMRVGFAVAVAVVVAERAQFLPDSRVEVVVVARAAASSLGFV